MSQSDWDEQFDLFAINNFHERENAEGTGYDVSLEVKRITSGTTIANRPYVIRPKSYSEENPTMTIDMTDDTEVTGIEDIHVVNTPSDGCGIYDLTGRKLAKEPAKGMYIKNNRVVFKLKD